MLARFAALRETSARRRLVRRARRTPEQELHGARRALVEDRGRRPRPRPHAPLGAARMRHVRRASSPSIDAKLRLRLLTPDHGHSRRSTPMPAIQARRRSIDTADASRSIRRPLPSCQGAAGRRCSRPRSAPRAGAEAEPRPASTPRCRAHVGPAQSAMSLQDVAVARIYDGRCYMPQLDAVRVDAAMKAKYQARRARRDEVAQDDPLTSPRWRRVACDRARAAALAFLVGRLVPRARSDARPADDH